jgi:hypothetical protein
MENNKVGKSVLDNRSSFTFIFPPTYSEETEMGLTEVWCKGPSKVSIHIMPGKDDIVLYE